MKKLILRFAMWLNQGVVIPFHFQGEKGQKQVHYTVVRFERDSEFLIDWDKKELKCYGANSGNGIYLK